VVDDRGASPSSEELNLGLGRRSSSTKRASGGEVLDSEAGTDGGVDEWLSMAKEWPERNYKPRGSSWTQWCSQRRMDEDGR
jgi:hypothetical protein